MKLKRKYFGITALLRSVERRFFYLAWVGKVIFRIKDHLNAHDNFLSFQELKDTFHICGTFLDYGGLLAAIPKDWKNAILHGNQEHTNEPKVTQLTVGNVSAKYA